MKEPKPNIADRLVAWINPVAGARRKIARNFMAMGGGYTGADRTRRANQQGWRRELSADDAIMPDLRSLREESQHMARNNALAIGAIKTNVTKVIGTGLSVRPVIDRDHLGLSQEQADAWEKAARREFNLAADSRDLDWERQQDFYGIQSLVFGRMLEDGDIFVNLPRLARRGQIYSLRLQLIEAARVCNPNMAADNENMAGGVERDAAGIPVRVWVLNRHPGAWRLSPAGKADWKWQGIDLFDRSGNPACLHIFEVSRPGQSRGVPYLAPVIELIKQLGRYTDAEVMAAVVSGMFTVFITNDQGSPAFGPAPTAMNPDGSPGGQNDPTGLELGYGSVVGLLPGEQISTATPGRPNTAYDTFVLAILRSIGMALELPLEVLTKHFTSSYSAARAALEEASDYFMRRRALLVSGFCQPVYEAIISEAVARGRLAAPGFFTDAATRKAWLGSQWIGDAQASLDPLKEINAAKARIDLGISTREEERNRLLGQDWEPILPQIMKEREIFAPPTPPKNGEDER
ncbi:MAG: phage portal protein [Desulfobulbaceae bacterium]|nr:phage portal protein [Desulfobulbaceae bacterium]